MYIIIVFNCSDDEQYNCMRVMKRSNNILEFQLGTTASKRSDFELCANNNFEEGAWITQGRKYLNFTVAFKTIITI